MSTNSVCARVCWSKTCSFAKQIQIIDWKGVTISVFQPNTSLFDKKLNFLFYHMRLYFKHECNVWWRHEAVCSTWKHLISFVNSEENRSFIYTSHILTLKFRWLETVFQVQFLKKKKRHYPLNLRFRKSQRSRGTFSSSEKCICQIFAEINQNIPFLKIMFF